MGTQDIRFRFSWDIEKQREFRQLQVDNSKDIDARRKNGQFSTPIEIANEMMGYGLSLLTDKTVRFLEPAVGTGTFISALLNQCSDLKNINKITGIEVDYDYYSVADELWKSNVINLENEDFTVIDSGGELYNLLITNPPYVRHHYLDKDKKRYLKERVKIETGLAISGLAGLYCYYLLLANKYLSEGAICGWLLPTEFLDVNYGASIKEYLLNDVQLIRVHRYSSDSCIFNDALVSSCAVWFKKSKPLDDYKIQFTYGGSHEKPDKSRYIDRGSLSHIKKWTHVNDDIINALADEPTIGDYFEIKRGLATGDNAFFILNGKQIKEKKLDMKFFKPILPSPRNMREDEVLSDENGIPSIPEPLYLLDCNLDEKEIAEHYPALWNYLKCGLETTATKYLCKSRKKWYFQEQREPTPFLCSYMGRGKEDKLPFRFILNHSKAIASNSYLLLYPKEELNRILHDNDSSYIQVWNALKGISAYDLETEGRVYGGGLKKIEPNELSKVKCKELKRVIELY